MGAIPRRNKSRARAREGQPGRLAIAETVMDRRQFVQSFMAAVGASLACAEASAWQQPRASSSRPPRLRLWYPRAAVRWVEALPVGNGRLGAMVFGDVNRERLQLNDDTLWSGGPAHWDRPGAREVLPEVRRLARAGRYVEADALSARLMGAFTQSYLPLGDLWITFEHGNVSREYRRTLDLTDAVASVHYRIGDVGYTREVIASHPAGVVLVRLRADRPGMLTFDVQASSLLRYAAMTDGRLLRLAGEAPAHVDPSYTNPDKPVQYGHDGGKPGGHLAPGDEPPRRHPRRTLPGMRFELVAGIASDGRVRAASGRLSVEEAREALLVVATATGFNGFDKDPALNGRDPAPIAAAQVMRALDIPWARLREEHVAGHRELFDRVALELAGEGAADLATDARIRARGAADPGLVELLFQYGRYLLIGSSRPGTQPANLQGIWNQEVRAPWSSNYTININTQMNYWPAEPAGLPELHEPLLTFVRELATTGRRTASEAYGTRGWAAHHNSDVWRHSAMVGDWGPFDPVWSAWQFGGAWLAQHLYEHYLFGGDVRWLRDSAYPVLRGAAEFCLDWLVEDKGYLVTAPSTSPENRFRLPSGETAAISVGTTMDMALMRDLFAHTADAAEVLGIDAAFRTQLLHARERLRPYAIGSKGQLLEWEHEFDEPEPDHRHISHLYGLHPGRHITPATPALFGAVRRSHELRGDGGTGWSLAWKINQWARLLDGDHAFRLLGRLLTLVSETGAGEGGGVYPNLLDAHPPFQIDGNFGATAGILEMLAQGHADEIHLLPALPRAWPRGRVRGVRLHGGFEVDLEWSGGALARAELRSRLGGVARVRAPHAMKVAGAPVGPADGPNPNPFFRVYEPGRPTIAPGAPVATASPLTGIVIDIVTEPGARVVLSA
jgi:alpha-L-fucosidase 2